MINSVSPTRTYVIFCVKRDNTGYIPKKFTLPETRREIGRDSVDGGPRIRVVSVPNTAEHAVWYYLNVLDFESVVAIIGAISFEDYSAIKEWDKIA